MWPFTKRCKHGMLDAKLVLRKDQFTFTSDNPFITEIENTPYVFYYFFLDGICKRCGEKINPGYMLPMVFKK